MKKIILFAVAVGVAGVIWLLAGGTKQAPKPAATEVIVAAAAREKLSDNIEALGTTYSNESINITASAAEIISAINFEDGQQVKKGQIIAQLEQREEQAQLDAVKVQISEHKRELERIESLLKNRAASRRDFDERQTLLRISEQEAQSIEARIEDRTLRAPFDGVLGIRRLSVGALVQPGDIITTLDDIDPIKLDFTVPAIYLTTLKPGVAIEATSDALDGRVFSGKVETIDTRADPVTRAVLVRALLPNPDGDIRPGLLMQITLLRNPRESIVVPEESVIQKQTDHFVMVVDPQTMKAEQRKVTTGVRRPGIVEIVDGLSEGEQVVVRGVSKIKDGQTVSVAASSDTSEPKATAPEAQP